VAHTGQDVRTATPRLVSKAQGAACWFYELPTDGAGYTEIKRCDLGISTAHENSILIHSKH